MKKIILISLITLIFTASYSQTDTDTQKKRYERHSLGVSGGMSHAFGLSYQYWGDKFGVHTSFTPYADFETDYMTAFSIAPMISLHDGKRAKYFMYEANGFYIAHMSHNDIFMYMPAIGAGSKIWITENLNINIALGLGILFASEDTDFPEFTMLPDINFGFYYSF